MALLLIADPNPDMIKSYWDKSKVFIARDDNKIIGVALSVLDLPVAELKNISVEQRYQCQGVARGLIGRVKEHALNQGAIRLTVGTGNSSLHQLEFYQKRGFRIASVEKDFFKCYPDKIIENNIQCLDLIWLEMELG